MKKILVCVMVLALCLCATISSFAAGQSEADYTGQTGNQDVNVTIWVMLFIPIWLTLSLPIRLSLILPARSGIPRTMFTSRVLRLRGKEKVRLRSSTTPICLLPTR